jgi:hypothetical protein
MLTQHKLKYVIEWDEPRVIQTKLRSANLPRLSEQVFVKLAVTTLKFALLEAHRFVATMDGPKVVGLGLVDATINQTHQIVSTSDLAVLGFIYEDILEREVCREDE